MIVIGHVKAGNLQAEGADEIKELSPLLHGVSFQRGERFKRAAALTGHFTPDAHIGTAVIVNGDAGEVFTILIALCAFGVRPRHMEETERIYDLLRCMYF